MRHHVQWRATATIHADVEIEIEDLAAWAVATGLVHIHAPSDDALEALETILERNPHARAQLLRLWVDAHRHPTTVTAAHDPLSTRTKRSY